MESLLSLSFDNISSRDISRIKKGLRQIEGLLAQICLIGGRSRQGHKRTQSEYPANSGSALKKLDEVSSDPAFREFFRLQESFEGNVASRVIGCLERLLGMSSNDHTNALILSTLNLLQGILLLHPPSRSLFRQETYMNILLDLLDASNPASIQSQALLVLVSALLAAPENTRVFENLDGLLTVASLFKSRATSQEVKLKVVEFFYFYLMPEVGVKSNAALSRQPSKRVGSSDKDGKRSTTRSTDEKQQMLGKYMSNVAELVQDLEEMASLELSV